MKKFDLEEIKNYIISQDSLGDVLYNLNEEKIEQANIIPKVKKYFSYSNEGIKHLFNEREYIEIDQNIDLALKRGHIKQSSFSDIVYKIIEWGNSDKSENLMYYLEGLY